MPKPDVKSITKPKKEKFIKKSRFFLQTFELHANLRGYNVGSILSLECDRKTKAPRDPYWRKRLKDAQVDGCISLYKEPKEIKSSKDLKEPTENENSNE